MQHSFAVSVTVALAISLAAPGAWTARPVERLPTPEEIRKIEDAMPPGPPVKPAKPRKVLVWGHAWSHLPTPFGSAMMEVMAKKTGAFEAVVSEDPAIFLPGSLRAFDAIVMNNIHETDPFLPAEFAKMSKDEKEAATQRDRAIKQSILDFVAGGKGVVGIHAATAAFQSWPEYGAMMGGYYGGHITEDVWIKLEDPGSPLCAPFGGKPFQIHDEIYTFQGPHTRENLRILLSLDLDRMKDPGKRPDKDYAVSWVRRYGKGRVFYCSLGHMPETYWNPTFLRHVLAGVQFATGDLEADATPSAKAGKEK